MTTQLVEYKWNEAAGKFVLTNTFTFDPEPTSLRKTTFVEWRVRHSGRKRLKKRRFRRRLTETYSLQGLLNLSDVQKLEAFSKRHSLFKIVTDLDPQNNEYPPASVNAVFVIKKLTIRQVSGRSADHLAFQYTLELDRVSDKDVEW